MMTRDDLQALYVPLPQNTEGVLYRDGDTQDIISAILFADAKFRKTKLVGNVPALLETANGYETLNNVWLFVKSEMSYKQDKSGHEKIKAPNWMLYNKLGDCKSYSVLIAAILHVLGIKYVYRFVGFDDDRANPTHVYIVAYLDNKEVILDAVHTAFDVEPPHIFSIDRKPNKSIGFIRL